MGPSACFFALGAVRATLSGTRASGARAARFSPYDTNDGVTRPPLPPPAPSTERDFDILALAQSCPRRSKGFTFCALIPSRLLDRTVGGGAECEPMKRERATLPPGVGGGRIG